MHMIAVGVAALLLTLSSLVLIFIRAYHIRIAPYDRPLDGNPEHVIRVHQVTSRLYMSTDVLFSTPFVAAFVWFYPILANVYIAAVLIFLSVHVWDAIFLIQDIRDCRRYDYDHARFRPEFKGMWATLMMGAKAVREYNRIPVLRDTRSTMTAKKVVHALKQVAMYQFTILP